MKPADRSSRDVSGAGPDPSVIPGVSKGPVTGAPSAAGDVRDASANDSPFDTKPLSRRARMLRRAVYGAAIVLALIGTWLATRDSGTPDPAVVHGTNAAAGGDSAVAVMLSDVDAERIGVTFATATLGAIAQEIRTVGQVTIDETRVSTVAPRVDGFVEELHVSSTGQMVRRGEPLLSIYSPMLVAAQEELLLARRLVTDVAGGTADAVRAAQELLASARRRLLYWDVPESEIDRIERTGEVRRAITLASPASGFVVEKAVFPGQRIMAGDAILKLADLGVVWVEGQVFEQDLASIRAGQSVAVTVDAFPSEEWRGRVAYVYPTLDAESRTTRIRVALSNSGLRLKPGMYATLEIAGTVRADVVSVPRSAVLWTGKRTLVFVRRPDGMLEPRDVAVGATSDDRVEIRGGLAAGESVVASATFLIDAESNLGSVLGGMANMPGMDMPGAEHPKAATPAGPPGAAPPRRDPSGSGDPHAAHRR